MSLQRCQDETTSTQFLSWLAYLDYDVNAFHREDWFLAQIAQEVRRLISNKPKKVRLNWFLLKFTNKKEKKRLTKAEKEKAAARQKKRILAWAGIKLGR